MGCRIVPGIIIKYKEKRERKNANEEKRHVDVFNNNNLKEVRNQLDLKTTSEMM